VAKPAGKTDLIRSALASGERTTDIAKRLSITKSSVSYHAGKLGIRHARTTNFYDWSEIKKYLETHGVRQTIRHFGISKGTFSKAVKRGDIANKPLVFDLHDVFVPGKARHSLKRGLLRLGVPYECAIPECKANTWLGRPLALQLDHINGDKQDNRPINLRFICPNCHSQTETFAGRNIARKKRIDRD
jgi:hypothetical protein